MSETHQAFFASDLAESDVGLSWNPVVGQELLDLLERKGLTPPEQEEVERSSLRILGRCAEPTWDAESADATLVVGAVQSGKTLSFTAVISAARDNNYPMVIVLAGVTNNLRKQTFGRLKEDLAVSGPQGAVAWSAYDSPGPNDVASSLHHLKRWQVKKSKLHSTIVAVVLKNQTRVDAATEYVSALRKAIGRDFPILIIDDEADQAGLNTLSKKGRESSTYAAIQRLRAASANHTYLMYTATPQANLLVSIADAMSPRTVTVLKSGQAYVGGQDLFETHQARFLRPIGEDLSVALEPSSLEPPGSLGEALTFYLLALALAWPDRNPFPLTMLVHPSSGKSLHSTYERWVTDRLEMIQFTLDDDEDDAEEIALELFMQAYEDLSQGQDIPVPALEELLETLRDILPSVIVRVVNSDAGLEIGEEDWNQAPGWIVIGGDKLNRGFTVRNLAVTYMPRGPGVGNVDTVQQRGRFFGYKRAYLSLLRGWMSEETADVYRSYVEHESAMRADLEKFDFSGRSLAEWRRSFMLQNGLKLTRSNVISIDLDSYAVAPDWTFTQTQLFGWGAAPSAPAGDRVRALFASSAIDTRDSRLDVARRNRVADCSLGDVLPILVDWEASPAEKAKLDALILVLKSKEDSSDTPVAIYDMDGAISDKAVESRKRGLAKADLARLGSLPEGSNAQAALLGGMSVSAFRQGQSGSGANQYAGDSHFVSEETISIQFHRIAPSYGAAYDFGDRLAMSIWLPDSPSWRVFLQQVSDEDVYN